LKYYNYIRNIILNSKDSNNGFLNIYLQNKDSNNNALLHLYVKYLLVVRNYDDYSCFFAKNSKCPFFIQFFFYIIINKLSFSSYTIVIIILNNIMIIFR